MYDYDLLVLGAGSGGVRASRLAGAAGKKVAVVEGDLVGGTCVIRGCVPKKLMVYAGHFQESFDDSLGYGWSVENTKFDWNALKQARDNEVMRLNGLYKKTLANNNVTLIEGFGKFVDAHTVELQGKTYTAEHILIATGGMPFIPDIQGKEHFITSNEIFHLPELPKHLLVVGAGFIALEFAGIFKNLGVDVTLIHRGDKLLRGFDEDIRDMITQAQSEKGIKLHLQTTVEKIESLENGQKRVFLSNGNVVEGDEILCAIGRRPNIHNLNLAAAGVMLDGDFIKVDENFKTQQPHIGAVGDVIHTPALTPVALRQAMAWLQTVFYNNPQKVDYEFLASAVFSNPNIGTAGYSETVAKETFGSDDIDIYKTSFRPMLHTLSGREEKMMMKLVVRRSTDRVVGVHMVGYDAGETVQGLAIALTAGATKSDFDQTIGIHPTAAEEFTTLK